MLNLDKVFFPNPDTRRERVSVFLPPDLVDQVDKARQQYRWDFPEITGYRNRFVEAALRYFLGHLPELTNPTS